jgi:O-acetyl-ADP-ribose deacetylase (regulator of RNase III)
LAADRRKLPIRSPDGVRCFTGDAVRTGPNRYGELLTPYVIHAVGPNYNDFTSYFDDDNAYYNNDDPASSHAPANEGKEWGFPDNDGDDAGPDALISSRLDEGHELLRSAYQSSLDLALEAQCQQVAFSLLSAGVYRGPVPLHRVFEITAASIQEWAYRHLDDTSPAAPASRKSAAVTAAANANAPVASPSQQLSRRPPMEVILCAYSPAECQTLVEACRRVFEA